ncbi:Transposon Ty3-G Gag-Pol polyprotein [Porphyridium purpureum]|uniref:RNA-directed DNA polymerase n=1 Tax=Porphyridium purpureum TaxID=35688 RepID=A0A5J4YI02_PORPP|nr:Transposon Ty3-G Gag-Pol polyprotein [Porphyridium purpureum]KAA8490785.1 Transposon Ty3-G Gag-Pol polyprotein [Porphyridium purpureum]KAA8495847.1 Transposon Ty3-G Gag-Pol polyprotein [Porphyridium purpureum]KAA8499396.1 Transposon Ty3-G Gag-Pol polyprotein [Porphyridium purpureum]|eukprot:POR2639..scf209_3
MEALGYRKPSVGEENTEIRTSSVIDDLALGPKRILRASPTLEVLNHLVESASGRVPYVRVLAKARVMRSGRTPVKVSGSAVDALADTGAVGIAGVYARAKWVSSLGAVIQDVAQECRTAGGSSLGIVGASELQLQIGQSMYQVRALVAEDLIEDLILGWDFWVANANALSFGKGELEMKDGATIRLLEGAPAKSLNLIDCVGVEQRDASKLGSPNVMQEDEEETRARIMDVDLSHVDVLHQSGLRAVLLKHWRVFRDRPGRTRSTEHSIAIDPGARLTPARLRRLSEVEREAESTLVQRLLSLGILEPCSGPYASANVIIRKPNGKWRLTTDFRQLNSHTVPDRYPIPDVRECLDWMGRFLPCGVFSVMDLADGFFQVPLAESSRDFTGMITAEGLFRYTVLAQGLRNSPATFQRLVNTILGSLRWKHILMYLDDMLTGTKTIEKHLEVLDVVLSNTAAILKWPYPKGPTELLRFLGLVNWFRDFIPRFSDRAAPLRRALDGLDVNAKKAHRNTDLECAGWQARFGEDARCAFDGFKEVLTSDKVMLVLADPNAPKVLDTDASQIGLGGALYQEMPDGKLAPISFLSRTLTSAEQNYTVTELECLAVVWCLKKVRHYVFGTTVRIRTDHEPLRWLLSMKEPRGRLARWALTIQDFSFTIEHVKGRLNRVPDALSRLELNAVRTRARRDPVAEDSAVPTDEDDPHAIGQAVGYELPSPERLKAAYREDELLSKELAALQKSPRVYSYPEYYLDESGLAWAALKDKPRKVVPDGLVGSILDVYHSAPFSGHFGVSKTAARISDAEFWWPGWLQDVLEFVKQCRTCAARKGSPTPVTSHRMGKRVVTRRFEVVAADVLTVTPRTSTGYSKILVVSDLFTRFTIAICVRDERAETIAEAFLDRWAAIFGLPEALLSDNGPCFRADVLRQLCKMLRVRKLFTTAYNPQANGAVERFNRTLCDMLSSWVTEDDWDLWLPACVAAFNQTRHSTTQRTPYELMFGREANSWLGPFNPAAEGEVAPQDSARKEDAFVILLRNRLEALHNAVVENDATRDARRRELNASCRIVDVEPGDCVFVWKPPLGREGRKLADPWVGPFEVERADEHRAWLKTHDGKEFFVHRRRLKRVDRALLSNDTLRSTSLGNADGDIVEVSGLKARRERSDGAEYLVAWKGARKKDWTWESSSALPPALVWAFNRGSLHRGTALRSTSGESFL